MDQVDKAKNLGNAVVDQKTEQGVMPREWKLSSPMVNDMLAKHKGRGTMPVYGIDVPTVGESEMTHYGGVQVCGNRERAEQIVREHNAHHALVEALRFTDNGHGHFAGCVRDTPADPSRPCRKSCELARAALALAKVQ